MKPQPLPKPWWRPADFPSGSVIAFPRTRGIPRSVETVRVNTTDVEATPEDLALRDLRAGLYLKLHDTRH